MPLAAQTKNANMINLIVGIMLAAAIILPAGSVQVNQQSGECPDGTTVLRYMYATPDGNTLITYKEPNKEIRLMLKYTGLPDEDRARVKVWDMTGEISKDELIERYSSPCDLFKKS